MKQYQKEAFCSDRWAPGLQQKSVFANEAFSLQRDGKYLDTAWHTWKILNKFGHCLKTYMAMIFEIIRRLLEITEKMDCSWTCKLSQLICLTRCCLFSVIFSKRRRGRSKCTSKITLSYFQILWSSYLIFSLLLSYLPFHFPKEEGEGLNALAGQFRSLPLLAAL